MVAMMQEEKKGTPVRLKRADHPEIRYGHIVDPPGRMPDGMVCVRFPSGFWAFYPPDRLTAVSDADWGVD